MKRVLRFMLITVLCCYSAEAQTPDKPLKKKSVLYTPEMIERATENARHYKWAADIRNKLIEAAQPWIKYTDDDLWEMMFGNTISRSWMVWSDGYCPACNNDVRMYSWKMDAHNNPWKVRCPVCNELFPKNDFHAFYRSGLDKQGIFDPDQADRKLLYNLEHPDPADSLHMFGVDDGEGYVEGDKRWRFIGTYLIYGHWKQAIVGGIRNLAAAYVVTGDREYAHKAGILLDRVADLYTTFDFGEQGIVYERKGDAGYISTWHDACREHHEIVIAYDQVFEALRDDTELVSFLAQKARHYKLENPKTSFTLIQKNIENGILRDSIKNRSRIRSNYPTTEIALALTHTVLGWPDNRDAVYEIIDAMVEEATAVDGLSGEKGLAAYSSYPINAMAHLLETFARMDSTFLPEIVKRHPNLRKTYRFHIDTWFNGEYYPQIGDTGRFASKYENFPSARASTNPGVGASIFSFLWKLYELTGDHAYVQLLYRQNGNSAGNLPYDLFSDDPETFQKRVEDVITAKGSEFDVGSVNKEEWCLAMMRSGRGDNKRAFWLDYDSGERHSHIDCMNLGLFAKGLDLLPEFGYPPVQFGGWGSPKAVWVRKTAAHNTVVVDGRDQDNPRERHKGRTTLWADGDCFRAVRASAPEVYDIDQYERTVALVDISENDFYLIDIFRVAGGTDHAKFTHSYFGAVNVFGLSLQAADDYGHDTIMRDFFCDRSPEPGWCIEWKIDDRYNYLSPDSDVRLRYTDLTTDAEAFIASGWISPGSYNENEETWIPRVMVRRRADNGPLATTFVSLMEPYEGTYNIVHARRLPIVDNNGGHYSDAFVAVEIDLADGRRDVIIAADVENQVNESHSGTMIVQGDPEMHFDGDLCFMRYGNQGEIQRVALYNGTMITSGDFELKLREGAGFVEVSIDGTEAIIKSGNPKDIIAIKGETGKIILK